MTDIYGFIKKVIYKSPYTNSCKILFKEYNTGNSYIAEGNLEHCFPGISYVLSDVEELDDSISFKSSFLSSIPDITDFKKSVKLFLSSQPFEFSTRDISRIIKEFGSETINKVIFETEDLLSIDKIDSIKVMDVIEFLQSSKILKDLGNFLSEFSVPVSYASKLFNFYGDKSLYFLKNEPVRCGLDGAIPINVARYISKVQGLPINSNDNLTAIIIEGITHFENLGNTYVETDELLDYLTKKTQVKEKQPFTYALKYALNHNFIKFKENDGKFLLYKTVTYNNEQSVADNIMRIKGTTSLDFNINYEIGLVEDDVGFKFAPEQVQAIRTAFKNTFSIITGPAGCGKTSLLVGITKIFKKKFGGSVLLCAPTGKAANRMFETTGLSAYTIHRALNMKPVLEDENIFSSNIVLKYDLIIIDESSMLDNDLAAIFFQSIKRGTKVVLLGDPNQLPSVGCGDILKNIIESGVVPVTKLTTIYRQGKTSSIVVNANRIIEENDSLDYDEKFEFLEIDNDNDILNKASELYLNYAQKDGTDNVILLSPYRTSSILGCNNLNQLLEPYANPEFRPFYTTSKGIFKVGDLVIRTQNDNKLDICNGAIGVIAEINQSAFVVDFELDKTYTYPFSEFANFELAYANTVHKSQGSEYSTVIFVCSPSHKRMLNNQILYTAITRAKNKVIVLGDKETFFASIHKKNTIIRNTGLTEKLISSSKL